MSESLSIRRLPSGYVLVTFNAECWTQLPPGFCRDTIPGEYIFHDAWNHDRVNEWWRRTPCLDELGVRIGGSDGA